MVSKDDKETTINHVEKVIIYTRVSSRKQVESGNWLESQEQVCRERINNQWWKVELVKVFSDWGVSGKYKSREWLDAMIEFLKKENQNYTKISRVVIDDIDRIIRDVAGWWEIKAKIEDLWWAKIHSLKQDINDTPEGNMLQSITMSVKQYERENNARRTKDRQRWRLLNWYRCFNALPWYKFRFDDELGKKGWRVLELSEPNASVLKEWFELFARWVLLTIVDFQRFLDKKWFITKSWWRLKKNSDIDRVFEKDNLLFYCWIIDFPKRDISMINARHPAIISEETMNQILDKLNPIRRIMHVTNSKEKNEKELPLRWILTCEYCNKPMTWAPSLNKIWNYYFYYTCRNKVCIEYWKSFNNKKVHSHLEDLLEKMKIQNYRIWLFEDVINDIWEWEKKVLLRQDTEREKRIESINFEVTKIQDRIVNTESPILVKTYEERLVSLVEEQDRLKIEDSITDREKFNPQYLITNTKPILSNPLLVREKKDSKLRKLLISILFSNQIFYNKKSGIQTPKFPLIYSLLSDIDWDSFEIQDRQELNPRRGALETPALPLSYGPIS